jgi:membrane protease YdiL (CAAX protease family)
VGDRPGLRREPLAEEFLYLGFLSNVLRRRGATHALVPAIAARMALHIYQGPARVVAIGGLGSVWTLYYYRTRRLWPVVIAHGMADFLALIAMNSRAL